VRVPSDAAAAHPAAPAPIRRSRTRLADDERALSRVLLAPAILYVALLVGAPFVLAIVYSLTSISLGGHSFSFVGLQNFQAALRDPSFRRALGNTILFAFVSQILVLVLASVLAIALQREFRGKWLVRLLILLPWVAPISLGTIGWLWIFDSIYSVINWTLRALHIFGSSFWPIWLGQPKLAMISIVTVQVWRTLPLATVILLGGLSGIPQDIHDAAEVDGAGFFRHMFQITVPLVLPIALVATLFGFVFAFTDMIVVYVLTRGGPFDSTQVLASLAFFKSVDGGDLGGGAAVALFLLPVLAAAAVTMLRMARRAEVT
jgi:multiple sugar transport system permease protein